jgi:hypothetical protein
MIALERQAITDTTRLPRHPGPRAQAARCQCGKVLGVTEGAVIFIRHDGRELTATLPAEVRCEKCGKRTMLSA